MTKTLKLFIVSSVLLFTAFYSLGSKSVQTVSAWDHDDRPECGNGKVENGEQCDDGNENENDSCDNDCHEVKKVKICHWDNGQGGKYESINVSINSVNKCENAAGHEAPQHQGKDIIPQFNYGSCTFPGQNTNLSSFLQNDCKPVCKKDSDCADDAIACTIKKCQNPGLPNASCEQVNQPVNGGWSEFGPCSEKCGPGIETRYCNNPSMSCDGNPCVGESTRACNIQECACSDTDNDEICDTVDNCPNNANSSQTDTDNDGTGDACETPVNCVFHYGECSALCGDGTEAVIVDTPASYGGTECPTEPRSCSGNSCGTKRWCFEDEESSTGYVARAIPLNEYPEEGKAWESGKMIDRYCAYAAEEQCPTQCGQPASEVNDGKGGKKQCDATKECEISGTPSPSPTPSPTQTPVPTPTPTDSPVGGGDNGGSSPGAPVCNDPKPGTPSNLRVTRISSTQVRLDWDHASDPHTSYVVAYGPSIGNYPWGSPNVGNSNSYTVNSLTPGAQYCFYVRAQNNCMPGDKSNEVCINVGSTVKILGVTDNYNPLVDGIRESYGGDILGATTELMATAEVVYSQNKLPSGNTLASGQSISIPKIGVSQPIYNPARIGDDYTVGHQEVLHTTIDGSSVYYGHNGYDVFGGLYKTNIGDQVVTNNNGVNAGYQVTEKLFVHKSQVDSIKTSGDQIVLVTCSFTQPDYRIVIKASLTK